MHWGCSMTTLYQKQGRRYVPAREEVILNSMQEGAHLAIVKPGITTVTYNIEPDHAALIAASGPAYEAMCQAIQQAFAREPDRPLTKRQRAILEQFIEAGGGPDFRLKSAGGRANEGKGGLIKRVEW